MIAAQSPLPFYVDLQGNPLQAGSVYFGVAGQNPETDPVSVYWDSAGTQPAQQPIRTINGYAVRNGTPAQVYLTGDYSQTVKDSAGQLVYYFANSVTAGSLASLQTQVDTLTTNLATSNDAAKGAGQIGYDGRTAYTGRTVGKALATRVNVMDWIDPTLWAAIENGTSTADVWSAIQACVTAKPTKDIWVPAGLYRFTRGFYLKTGQCLHAETGATFKALAGSWVGTTGNTGTAPFVWNENNNTTTLTDKDISVENLTFDYDTVVVVGGGAHAVRFRAVTRPRVINSRFYNGENATAMLACKDSLVDECEAYNVSNCFFDHWDGCIGGTVRDCIGRNDAGVYIAQGIQFTGTGSVFEDRNSLDFLATGNRLYGVRGASGQSSAIIFNTNDAGSTATRCKSIANYIEDADNGLVFQGPTGQHLSADDTFRNVTKLPIFLQDDGTGSPSNCRVIDPTLIDCNHLSANIGMISVAGTNNRVRGVRVVNTGAVAYENIARIVTTSVGCTVDIEDGASGTVGRIANESTTGKTRDKGDLDYSPKSIPTIASAGTIAPTAPVTFISGTAAIATITPPDFCKLGGRITLVPIGNWTITTAGNVQAAVTAVAYRTLDLTFDPDTAKWMPSYV